MMIGIGKWPGMPPAASLISSLTRHARPFARNRCEIGRNQKLDLEDDSGILAALRTTAGARATFGG